MGKRIHDYISWGITGLGLAILYGAGLMLIFQFIRWMFDAMVIMGGV